MGSAYINGEYHGKHGVYPQAVMEEAIRRREEVSRIREADIKSGVSDREKWYQLDKAVDQYLDDNVRRYGNRVG